MESVPSPIGASLLVECLYRHGVRHVFGMPGSHSMAIYDALARHGKICTILVRNEQAGAGLNELTAAEAEQMVRNNARYREKFGFPFILCARLNNTGTILDAFARRLENSRTQEIAVALEEISKIGRLRLEGAIS